MDTLTVFVIVLALGFVLLRGPVKQMRMGNHLTRMTNILEEVEATRHILPIGAGGGIDSLPLSRQVEAERIFQEGIAYLKSFPRHEVTKALAKNAVLAERMGRQIRYIAIGRLLDMLEQSGVALSGQDFAKSYT
ncbi:MAG: hypothetical protein H2056_03430 [Sphingopyxis sp.]|nr:hypothetical protein [Sphingopyxis sp.]